MSICDTQVTESGTLAFRVALSVLRHREDAEDVAQEAVVRSLQRFHSLKDHTRFRAWLVRIAWRLALDRRRSDTRRAARDFRSLRSEGSDGSAAGAEHQLIADERVARLWAAIDDLPPRLRLPLVLSALQGHSVEEVSSLLGVPAGTVKSRAFEARQHLKKALIGSGVALAIVALVTVMTRPIVNPVLPAVQNIAHAPAIGLVLPRPAIVAQYHSDKATVATTDPVIAVAPPPVDAQLPGVTPITVPTIEIRVVDTRQIQLPTVHVPVVEVPTVKMPDPHSERQP